MTNTHECWKFHRYLDKTQGLAPKHPCVGCGKPAHDWAYQHNGGELEKRTEQGNPYALDSNCYLPMCSRCHRQLDNPGWASEAGKKGGEARTARLRSDPEFAQRVREAAAELSKNHGAAASAGFVHRIATDPQALKNVQEGAARARAKFQEQLKKDEGEIRSRLQEGGSRGGSITSSRRRRCTCGRVAPPGGMSRHQISTGHVGYEELTQ